MTIAGYDFFSCLILLEFVFLHVFWSYFSLTASFLACSLWPAAVLWLFHRSPNSMKKPSSCCLSLLAIASSMLDITLALIFSQLPHPECWMPRLPLEALNCFWLAFACLGLGARLVSRVCVVVEFVSRCSCYLCMCVTGLLQQRFSALWSVCDTVVILLFVQDYHSSYRAVLFSPPRGSNLTDIQHTDWL